MPEKKNKISQIQVKQCKVKRSKKIQVKPKRLKLHLYSKISVTKRCEGKNKTIKFCFYLYLMCQISLLKRGK